MFVRAFPFQGPGDYNPKLRPRYHLEMPGSSAFMSGVPKGGGAQYEVGPGPGQYIHQNPLGAGTSASNVPRLSSPNLRGAWLRSDKVRNNSLFRSYQRYWLGR